MEKKRYVVGKFKAGQDFAENLSVAFTFGTIEDALDKLIKMWEAWEDKPRTETDMDFATPGLIRHCRYFTDDVWTYAIFEIEEEDDALITIPWGSRHWKSNQVI